jgi:Probable zinc-ribbon domain
MVFQTRNLDCGDCRLPFPFSIEHQRLCAELGFDQPGRCPACRLSLEVSRRPASIASILA